MTRFLETLKMTFAASLLFTACANGTDFASKNKKLAGNTPNGQNASPQNGDGQYGGGNAENPGGNTSPGRNGSTSGPNPAEVLPAPCAQNRKILVIDLKSGWFAGDGGDFFKSLTNDNVCNGNITIHYVHFTKEFTEGNAPIADIAICGNGSLNSTARRTGKRCTEMKDLRSYDQLWLLSGDESDGDDISITSPLFQSIAQRARELRDANPKAGFYFGGGLGNIHHANALSKALFPEIAGSDTSKEVGLFSRIPGNPKGVFPSPEYAKNYARGSLIAGSGSYAGTFLSTEAPFKAFGPYSSPMAALFDYKKESHGEYLPQCFADKLDPRGSLLAASSFKHLATDHCGIPVVGTFQVGGHAVMADGNTARYYGMKPEEYFQRSILALLR
jgi:hypothetical protein